jgi:addiction module HigA family antidote
MEMYNPAHPGRLIRESMGEGLTVSALAKHLGVTRAHLSMIINGRAGLSATMALKLDETFENSDGFWWRLQSGYELAKARRTKRKKLKSLKKESFKTLAEISLPRNLKRTAKAEPRNLQKAA